MERTHQVRTGAVVRPSGAHRAHPVRTTMRTTVHPVRLHSVGGARTGAAGAREWCAPGGRGAVEWARVETVEVVRFSLT
ncbi:hypothetical protein [Streptomyces roseolilacinus]|uniref:Uncharacterized protein n=1 Tax=Streptomyces roseolilacinus TaxID=66904 RepID=A0A918EQ58_9ACTN|nr:hypothetical protein [Streptomyces roseolilacinus]GGQ33694.1 hypothetical protein GCM10010249_60240 [Streptomyces roseolilacinus]